MKSSHIILIIAIMSLVISMGCTALQKIGGSASGTVYSDGRPIMGQIQLLDPKSGGSLKTEPVNNSGHFIISDIPPGEYLLAFLGPSSKPLGHYKYVKIQPGRPNTGIVFEVFEEDPNAKALMDKVQGGGTTEEPAPTK